MRVLVTGLSTYWGGGLAQALEQRPDVEVVVGVDTKDPRTPLERTEFVRTDSSHSILARIVRATQVDTIVHTHLVVDSTRAIESGAARDQRDRHDEPARGRGRARQSRAQGRAEELRARLRREQGRTRTASAKTWRAPVPRAPPSNDRCSRSRRSCATSPTTTRTSTSACCASPTCSASTSTRRSPPRSAARWCPRSSASIRAFSSSTRTTSSTR